MKRFLAKAVTLLALVYGGLAAVIVWRCLNARDQLERSVKTPDGAQTLLLGSSCVGCSTIETNELGIAAIWQYRSPPQLSLVRLLELERRGELAKFRKVCLELGYQNFAYQTKQWMKDLFLQTLPMSWRYQDLTGVSPLDLFVHYTHNFMSRFELRSDNPFAWQDDISCWSETKKAHDWEELKHGYFDVLDDETTMIDDWPGAIERTIQRVDAVCKSHAIECEIIVFPISQYCRERIPAHAEAYLMRFMGFAQARGMRVRDLRSASPDSDFLNLNHLSRAGARKFMEKLAADD